MTNRGIKQKPTHAAHQMGNPPFVSERTRPIASDFPPMPKKPRKPPPFASSALNVCSAHVSLSIMRRANHRQLSAIKLIQIAMTACMATNPPDGSGCAIFSDKAPSGTSSIGGIDCHQDDNSAKHKHGTSGGCDPRNPSTKLRVEVYERFVAITGRHNCDSYETAMLAYFLWMRDSVTSPAKTSTCGSISTEHGLAHGTAVPARTTCVTKHDRPPPSS